MVGNKTLRRLAKTLATVVLTGAGFTAEATIIVDNAVEFDQNGWVSTGSWGGDGPGVPGTFFDGNDFLTPGVQEGITAAHINGSQVTNADVSLGSHTLQIGTYSISFSVGNYNNASFENLATTFAGLTDAQASSISTPIPVSGDWELWSLTWDVLLGNTNIGNPLSLSLVAIGGGNTAFDGVGALSADGSGFLVDFVAPLAPPTIPEPATLALLGLGLAGIEFSRRRKRH